MDPKSNLKWVVIFSGARDRYQVPLALAMKGQLAKLVTDFYAPQHGTPLAGHLISERICAKISRRYEYHLGSRLVMWSLVGLLSDYLLKRPQADRDRHLATRAGNLARRSECGLLSYSYYGYDAFHAYGINRWPKVLMQVHPHPKSVRKILRRDLEVSEFGKESLLHEQELSSDPIRFEQLSAEALLADHCIVTSNFTKQTLIENGVREDRIHRVPYGIDVNPSLVVHKRGGPFRVVFVGQMMQRKGLEYLLKAWKKLRLPNSELVLAGRGRVDKNLLAAFRSEFVYIGDLSDRSLGQLYQDSDLFCMPSLVEGFGLVYLEALAYGLPVIATPNTGAADIVQDGCEGFIVPIRDVEALAEKLEWAYRNRHVLAEMGSAARRLAEQYSWERFRSNLVAVVKRIESEGSCNIEGVVSQQARTVSH
jgi:glycosyltransferase involved in cell wall biosynthesis